MSETLQALRAVHATFSEPGRWVQHQYGLSPFDTCHCLAGAIRRETGFRYGLPEEHPAAMAVFQAVFDQLPDEFETYYEDPPEAAIQNKYKDTLEGIIILWNDVSKRTVDEVLNLLARAIATEESKL